MSTSTRVGCDIGMVAALESLRPGCNWKLDGDDIYSNIQWLELPVSEGGQAKTT